MMKAVFLDIDGTVLSHRQGKVPESTKNAIYEMKARGMKVFAATGRHILEMEKLPLDGLCFDGYVTLNGQLCLDEKKSLVYDFPIGEADTKELISLFEKKEVPTMIVEADSMYINYVDESVRLAQNAISTAVPEIGTYTGKNVYQVIVYDEEKNMQKWMSPLRECKENVWHPEAFDIIPKQGGKVAGIQKMIERLGIRREEIMAFGDGGNDVDMLRYAEIGIAMGNAGEHVKKHADYVTACVDDDGILKALKLYGIL